ncbi:unnamed protein product [Colias eurytheme]|nr:unnamed protein product [Colias eurytheme]
MARREDQENISSNVQTISIGRDDPEQGTNSKPTSETHECFKQNATLEQNSVDTQCEGQSIVDDTLSCKDVNQESECKENLYFEDSDDSVKDPNFEMNCNNKSSSSDSSFSRLTARKRVRRDSHFSAMEQKQQTQPFATIETLGQSGCMIENDDQTPSTSKCILQRRMSLSSNSSSSTSDCSSSNSSSNSSSSSSSNLSNSNEVFASLPSEQENVENEVSERAKSPMHKSTKKRKSCVDEWLTNKAKTMRNTGKPYTSRSKSRKNIPARSLKPPCGEKCKLECSKKITDAMRTKIFDCYWQLGDLSLQRNFIHKHIKPIIPAFRFSATLDINDRVIRTVIAKSEDGFLKEDMRGKHSNHKKVAESIRQGIRGHIESIPRMESHYIRKDSSREYIDGGKSLSDLYRDYKSLCESNEEPYANETLYSRIFNGEFNISFFKPKKDRCELCVRYENAQGSAKENLEVEYLKHIEEKELSRKEKDADKTNVGPDNIVAIYDLQAVLQLPRGNTSIFYYKSKLNTLNFTISQIGNDKTDCFFWHEGEANRGADEIGSCVYKFIENTLLNYDGPGLDLIFYSDNCCGQNKNRFIVSVYLFALLKFPKIRSITHKYLITGHTQNEADSVHSTIEKQIQKRLKSGPIYVPSQSKPKLKENKLKDLHELLRNNHIPQFYESFYNSLK